MIQVTVKLSMKEAALLASLASDQLFRREFIDPKMPGQKLNPAEIKLGKELVARLLAIQEPAAARKPVPGRRLHAV